MEIHEKFYIGTTRFNNRTFQENIEWRKKHNWRGCMYGTNKRIAKTIPNKALIFVIEMNNDTNSIEGIGLIRNFINPDYKSCIYKSDRNYNRYIYNSGYRKNITEINSKKVIEMLELILFYGYGHYKRGIGITTIKWSRFDELATKVLIRFFSELFN